MIFIANDVPSLKNSKKITKQRGRIVVKHSAAVEKYLHAHGINTFSTFRGKSRKTGLHTEPHITPLWGRENTFKAACGDYFDGIEYPARIAFHFVRKTKGSFDYINAAQLICDLLTAHGLIHDDDMRHVLPVFMDRDGNTETHTAWTHDAKNAGVFVKLL